MIDNELPWWILTGIIHINGGWWYVFQLLEGCKILYPATIIATNQVGESKHSGLWSNWCCDWRLAVCLVLAKLNWKEDPKEDHDIRTVKTIKPQDGWFHTKTDKLYRSRWYLNDVKDDIHGIHSPESSQNSGGYSSHPYLQFLPKHGWSNLGSCAVFWRFNLWKQVSHAFKMSANWVPEHSGHGFLSAPSRVSEDHGKVSGTLGGRNHWQLVLDDFGVLYPKSHGLSSCSPFNWSYITIGSILFWAFTQKSLSGTQLEAGRCWYLLGGLKSVRLLRPWLGGMGPQEPIRLASKHSWMFMISPYQYIQYCHQEYQPWDIMSGPSLQAFISRCPSGKSPWSNRREANFNLLWSVVCLPDTDGKAFNSSLKIIFSMSNGHK